MEQLVPTPSLVLGIDPGLSGAFAWLDCRTKQIERIEDFPISRTAKRPELYLAGTFALLKARAARTTIAVIESNDPRPGMDVGSMFRFGRSTGQIEGLLAALGIPAVQLRPAVWKPLAGVTADKSTSCAQAAKLYPAWRDKFYGPRGGCQDGRAEAVLLADLWISRLAAKLAPKGVLGGTPSLP